MIELQDIDLQQRAEASSPNTHLQSQKSSYLLVGLGSGLQKVGLSLLPSVEWCSVQEMSGVLPGGKDQLLK